MELLYILLIIAVLLEVFIFVLLNMPTPTGVKGRIAKFLENNRRSQVFLMFHLVVLLLAVVLWVDCNRMDDKYRAERTLLHEQVNIGTGISRHYDRCPQVRAQLQAAIGPAKQIHLLHGHIHQYRTQRLYHATALSVSKTRSL